MKKLRQSGDTIIEILIALSVLTFALSMGFATANRSNNAMQANKERYQAQLYANEQADKIRDSILANRSFLKTSHSSAQPQCLSPGELGTAPKTNTDCKQKGITGIYDFDIQCVGSTCNSPSSTFNVFKVHIEWDSLNGSRENVELYYGQ